MKMYKNFDEARNAAMKVIDRYYNGEKLGCCVIEYKTSKRGKTSWGFIFHSEGTNGKWVARDGIIERRYAI